MGTAWHSMWLRLVLAYQPVVWGSCDGRTPGMFDESVMTKPWDSVRTADTAGTHKHKRGLLGGYDAHTGSETLVGTLQAR
jgi:hypothetical protein